MGDSFSFDYPESRRREREQHAHDSNAAYYQEVRELKEALQKYGNHSARCSFINFKSTKCDCGFEEVKNKFGI